MGAAICRPDPTGPGAPCRDKLHRLQGMLDAWRLSADAVWRCPRRWLWPIASLAIRLMRHVATTHEGTFLVEKRVPTLSSCLMGAGQGE